jgi:hypothetical protein
VLRVIRGKNPSPHSRPFAPAHKNALRAFRWVHSRFSTLPVFHDFNASTTSTSSTTSFLLLHAFSRPFAPFVVQISYPSLASISAHSRFSTFPRIQRHPPQKKTAPCKNRARSNPPHSQPPVNQSQPISTPSQLLPTPGQLDHTTSPIRPTGPITSRLRLKLVKRRSRKTEPVKGG